jgi:nucleotide-binding universal stress UspA family protein
MSYTSILVHADQSAHAPARMALAARVALACGAHLTALACTGVSRYAQLDDLARQWPMLPEQLILWREQARASLAACRTIAAAAGLGQPTTHQLDDDPEDGLMLHAPFHDLLVLSQTDAHGAPPHGVIRDLPQNLLLNCGRPLLLAPAAGVETAPGGGTPFRHPLLAWDGGAQAARAISDALPLLKLADTVTLLVLNAEQAPAGHGMEPGADMALFLARHGVRVDVMREYTSVDIGDALLCVAAELHCDLLVMGGYGHRRARETLLGGATRSVLRDMTLPVLISH